jgi:murein DD-endopeptidase MepM/ murein hydrolase activator NlpD
MLKKNHYTIIVVTDYAKKLFKFSLSNRATLVALLIVLGFLGGLIVLSVTSLRVHTDASEVFALIQENRHNESQLKEFNHRLEEIEGRFDALSKHKLELMTMYGIENENDRSGMFGIGGPAPEDSDTLTWEKRYGFLDHDVMKEMDRLQYRMKGELLGLNDLLSIVEGQADRINSTPSIRPTKGFFCSGFGFRRDPITRAIRMHNGIDISNKIGTPVYASANGVVLFTGVESGYGNMITLDHGYGITTNYAHLNDILVREGDMVKRGDKIGTIGMTGRAIGPHLHYEVRINGMPIDPTRYITE